MKQRITEKKLRRFQRLLSIRMIDFDCGKLCAPKNNGIPFCCDNESIVPVLFHEEFNRHGKNGKFWKKVPVRNDSIRKMIEESASYYVFSICPVPANCRRSRRSLNCMTFPFEPHVSRSGEVAGLVYTDNGKDGCALMKKSRRIYNPVYIANSIVFWQELFDLYPEEKELYIHESGKRERRLKRQGKKIRVFK
ncbi:hypothetical protein BMS3Abin06_02359 [bacterium BMS3Abin06]|nr:hypothetical protein BMS3Abin06_02359 [bacterium BMS3Abin06]